MDMQRLEWHEFNRNLSQEDIQSILDYDADTGQFHWKVKFGRYPPGERAGSKDLYGYRHIMLKGKMHKEHRLAWLYVYGKFPDSFIDHINRVRDDNRICNLREATYTQNLLNTSLRLDNKSGYKGVSWHKGAKKWRATAKENNKQIHLGFFHDPYEAHIAVVAKNKELYGEFYLP